MRSRLRLSEVEHASEEEKEERKAGAEEAERVYKEVWGSKRRRGGMKNKGGDGHFSTLQALHFGESLLFKLVYLTFV